MYRAVTWCYYKGFTPASYGSCQMPSEYIKLFCNTHITEGDIGCSLEDLLIFVTGADRLPPLGFDKSPTAGSYPLYQHIMTLRLLTAHGANYSRFKEMMVMALKGHDGFGGV